MFRAMYGNSRAAPPAHGDAVFAGIDFQHVIGRGSDWASCLKAQHLVWLKRVDLSPRLQINSYPLLPRIAKSDTEMLVAHATTPII